MNQPATTLPGPSRTVDGPGTHTAAAPLSAPASTVADTVASTVADTVAGAGSDRYLTFSLGGELYALPILDIVEIIEYRPLTTVPRMPSYIRGVLNLRGTAVPVVDLSARFDREATTIARRTSILIVDTRRTGSHASGQHMGILVDAVNKVLHVSGTDIEPPPELGTDIRAEVIKGMAKHGEQFIVILDLEHVLAGASVAGAPVPAGV
jgi:purine-binding chemotaxis protein CheW